jgi:hypothetical protein
MIRLGLRPNSSGGISEPRRLPVPLPGAKELFLLPIGVTSLITSILGVSGALISGSFGYSDQKSIDQRLPFACFSLISSEKRAVREGIFNNQSRIGADDSIIYQ